MFCKGQLFVSIEFLSTTLFFVQKSSYFYAPKFYNPLQNLLFLKLPISSSEPAHILCSSCTTFSCIKFKFTRSQLVEKEVMIKWDFLGKMWSHKISALPEASAALTAWLLPRKYYGFRQLSPLKQCTYLLKTIRYKRRAWIFTLHQSNTFVICT